jgi:hypothetical protein
LVVTKVDSLNNFIDCFNTIPFGVGSNQYDEVNSLATLNFFRRTWKIRRNDQSANIENVFIFEDQGVNQFYAGGVFNTTYRINSFLDSLQPIYNSSNTEQIKMANYGDNMFINGTDLNGDSIMDLIVGLSTGGVKILYGSRVNNIPEQSNQNNLKESVLSIYPNPTNGEVTIEVLEETVGEISRIEIRSISGQLILIDNLTDLKKQLDISHLSKGIYFVTVSNSVKIETKKLVIRP